MPGAKGRAPPGEQPQAGSWHRTLLLLERSHLLRALLTSLRLGCCTAVSLMRDRQISRNGLVRREHSNPAVRPCSARGFLIYPV